MSGSGSYFDKKNTAWVSSFGPMKVINFHDTRQWQDKNVAHGCISVLTSDGYLGTLTHLDVSDKPHLKNFIVCLDKVLRDHKEKTHVILAGGSGVPESLNLYSELTKHLVQNGYPIVASYHEQKSPEPAPKIATIRRDIVLVKEFDESISKDKVTEIKFTNGKKREYYRTHKQ